jgi:hypothetical protein
MRHRSTKAPFALFILAALFVAPLFSFNAKKPSSSLWSKVKPYSRKPSQDALKWADKELKRMSLEEDRVLDCGRRQRNLPESGQ